MSAKEFGIRTVRCDWRTRKGMLAFLQSAWEKFHQQLSEKTIFRWYCTNFEACEKLFSNRKFIMFIYMNWKQYENFLSNPNTIICMRSHTKGIETLLTTNSSNKNAEWLETETGKGILEMVAHFKKGVSSKVISDDEEVISSPEESTQTTVQSEPIQTETAVPVSNPDDEIDLEYSFILFPQEFNFFESKDSIFSPTLEDAFIMDNFSI